MWTRNWIEGLQIFPPARCPFLSSNAINHWLVLDHGSQDKPHQVSTSTANGWKNRRTCRHHISVYCIHIPCISQHEIQIAPLLVPRHHIGDRENLLGTATLARGGGLRWRLCGYGRPAALGIGFQQCWGVDYFNPTFVAPQLTPKQFLIISSPSEQKIVAGWQRRILVHPLAPLDF